MTDAYNPARFWHEAAGAFCGAERAERSPLGGHHALLDTWLAELHPTSIMLVGVGFGRELPLLLKHTPHVTGVDISRPMLTEAARVVQDAPSLRFECADVAALPFPDASQDVVITFACLTHVPPHLLGPSLREVFRVGRVGILVEGAPPGVPGDTPCGAYLSGGTNTWAWDYERHCQVLGIVTDRTALRMSVEGARYLLLQGQRRDVDRLAP